MLNGLALRALWILTLITCSLTGGALAQKNLTPQSGPSSPGLLPYISIPPQKHHGPFLALDTAPTVDPTCSTVPTTAPFKADGFELMTIDQAGALNVNYGGKGDASAERNRKVMVREVSKYNECTSTDGKFIVQYGAATRLGVLSDDIQGKGELDFVFVAANATINDYHFSVKSQVENFSNGDAILAKATDAINITSGGGLSTENYATFAQKMNDWATLAATADSAPTSPFIRIGFRPRFSQSLRDALSMSFALPYVAKGNGCLDAIRDLNAAGTDIETSIRNAYMILNDDGNDCAASDPLTQTKAKVLLQLLNGKSIKAP